MLYYITCGDNMKEKYLMSSVNRKIMNDTNDFKNALLEVVDIIGDNIENDIFNGTILGEDLDNLLSKYGRLIKMDWYIENGKRIIVLDYSGNDTSKETRHGFDKYHLINFDYLQEQLADMGIIISKINKNYLYDTLDGDKRLTPYTDKLVLKMSENRKKAPLLNNQAPAYVRRLFKRYYGSPRYTIK